MKARTQVAVAITGTVIGGLILNFIGVVPFGDWVRAAWAGVVAAWTWLGGSAPIPRWLVGSMTLTTLVGAGALVFGWVSRNGKEARAFAWRQKYREDLFFNLKWRWQWNEEGQLQKLAAFCPACDLGLRPRGFKPGEVAHVTFHCGECNVTLLHVIRPYVDVETDVQMYIGRTLRRRAEDEKKAKAAEA